MNDKFIMIGHPNDKVEFTCDCCREWFKPYYFENHYEVGLCIKCYTEETIR